MCPDCISVQILPIMKAWFHQFEMEQRESLMKQYKEWNVSEYRASHPKCACVYELLSDDLLHLV